MPANELTRFFAKAIGLAGEVPPAKFRFLVFGLCATLAFVSRASAGPSIQMEKQRPCDLFAAGEAVKTKAMLSGFPEGEFQAVAEASGYFKNTKTASVELSMKSGENKEAEFDFGALEPGYYEWKVVVSPKSSGEPARSGMASFGVLPLMDRTAAEAKSEGLRFGLKMFQIGSPGIVWRKGLAWDVREVVSACVRAGLPWTRHQFNQPPSSEPGKLGTEELLRVFPVLAVLKVEGFPESCFDVERYGPLEDWKKKNQGKIWNRCTVPQKAAYQDWLRGEIAKLPASQNIFEIGNEVWNYLKAPEFAEWSRMALEVIKTERPEARVGADPGGGGAFTLAFLEAGGMDGMSLWCCHPYSFTPLPEHRIRGMLRNLRDLLKKKTGREFDLMVTEYGWSVAPDSRHPSAVSEAVQAQRTTRESLMLYAEDAKVLIPHAMGDRDDDPKNWDHWFGFFRIDQQPRPVFVAHATCARMIDGSRFVGDVVLGEGIGAMLFERGGTYTLALFTAEQSKVARIPVGTDRISVVNMMGAQRNPEISHGELFLHIDGNVTYVVGVPAALATRAIPPSHELDPDLWSPRKIEVAASHLATSPAPDGTLRDWKGNFSPLVAKGKADAPLKAEAAWAWDADFLHVLANVSDESALDHDVLQLGIGARPARQPDYNSCLIYDYNFSVEYSGTAKPPVLKLENALWGRAKEIVPRDDSSGIRWTLQSNATGWTLNMAIPRKLLEGLPADLAGYKASTFVSLRHFVTGQKDPQIFLLGEEKPRLWPYLVFKP